MKNLIQDHYKFYFDDLPGSNEVEKIKAYADAHKHRRGSYSLKEMEDYNVTRIPTLHEVDRKEVLQSIELVEVFFRSIKTLVEK